MARNKYDVDETLETKFDMKQIKRLFSETETLCTKYGVVLG